MALSNNRGPLLTSSEGNRLSLNFSAEREKKQDTIKKPNALNHPLSAQRRLLTAAV
jgi:hypothetical protein